MAKQRVSKVSSFFDSSTFLVDLNSVEDLLEMPVDITGVEWRKGPNGEYAVMSVVLVESGAEMKVSTGSMALVAALKVAEAQRQFPFRAKATKHNRMYLFVDAD